MFRTSGQILVPELLHRGRPRRRDVGRVVGRVVDGADDPFARRRHVEDVDAAGRLLERADEDALAALGAMAETYRTLQSGIYYEHAPEGSVARDLYTRVTKAVADFKQAQTDRAGFPSIKDSEIFGLLVFLLRVGKQEINGRPRSRAFLDFLRSWIPAGKEQREASRIITA